MTTACPEGAFEEITVDASQPLLELLAGFLGDVGDGPAAGDPAVVRRLVGSALAAVPSCQAVMLTVNSAGLSASFRLTTPAAGELEMPVRSSLLLPLGGADSDTTLLLYAGQAGAFDQLATELAGMLADGGLGVAIDQHLAPLPRRTAAARAAAALADGGTVNQALGALLEQGWPPEDGPVELDRRAAADGVSRSDAARIVLHSLSRSSIDAPARCLHHTEGAAHQPRSAGRARRRRSRRNLTVA